MQQILGLDIGGANVKAADSAGRSISIPFALWKNRSQLSEIISEKIVSVFGSGFGLNSGSASDSVLPSVALTMTGELCDCFASKSEGVKSIVDSVCRLFPAKNVFVYTTDGDFVSPRSAIGSPAKVAASNWHALAKFCTQFENLPDVSQQDYALLVDTGSTSTDIIPFRDHSVLAIGITDTTRIANHELLYTGAIRSPVCAVSDTVRFRGTSVSLAHEFFATMQDVYIVLQWLPEAEQFCETADGRSATIPHAKHRLARMLCADVDEMMGDELSGIAEQLKAKQLSLIQNSIDHQQNRFGKSASHWVVSGSGGFLIEKLVKESGADIPIVYLEEQLGAELSSCAPAYAVAMLLQNTIADSKSSKSL